MRVRFPQGAPLFPDLLQEAAAYPHPPLILVASKKYSIQNTADYQSELPLIAHAHNMLGGQHRRGIISQLGIGKRSSHRIGRANPVLQR
jgi:hypothetical protein